MKTLNILLVFILIFLSYSQEDSIKFSDCSCNCIKSLTYKTMPDSFKLGLKYPNPGAYNGYEYFSIPESSLVKFIVTDLNFTKVKETDFCLISQGNYRLSFFDLLKPVEETKSGIYFIVMTAISPFTYEQVYKSEKKFVLVK